LIRLFEIETRKLATRITSRRAALQIMTTEGVGRIGGSVFGDVYAVQCSRCG
jgi:hypothetical protein